MKPIPHRNISQLSSIDPDLELYQWQRLADYSDSSFSNFYLYSRSYQNSVSDFDKKKVFSGNIMTFLGFTATLLLLGSALWCRLSQFSQPYQILEEPMEIENAPTVNSFLNY